MYVLGTAGHVDHGKSALIAALTGIHPDRLKEEREREMTIDLGFAWTTLKNKLSVGIIDVPGHRDFIENMLSGVGGIDAALLLIAADEGVMPQTKEHVDILSLLNIQHAIVALSKIDLVEDEEWMDLVETEITDLLTGSSMQNAPIVRVSARNGEGIETLKNALYDMLQDTPQKLDLGRPRLPIDRSFSIAGFGTIVTGTLVDGSLRTGDAVVVQPAGTKGRIRGLQSHKKKLSQAEPGSRVAINISGISLDMLARGMVVCPPNTYRGTQRIECSYQHLPSNEFPLAHNTEVKLFCGSDQTIARVRVLGSEQIEPGQHGWLQLYLRDEIVVARKDPYILRRMSPARTLGGGIIIEPFSNKRHKRMAPEVLYRLKTLSENNPREIITDAFLNNPPLSSRELHEKTQLEKEILLRLLQEMAATDELIMINPNQTLLSPKARFTHRTLWRQMQQDLINAVQAYHEEKRLRLGIPQEVLRSRLKMPVDVFTRLLENTRQENKLVQHGNLYAIPDFRVDLSSQEQAAIQTILNMFQSAGSAPPTRIQLEVVADPEILQYLIERETLITISPDIYLEKTQYLDWKKAILEMIRMDGTVNVSSVRDRLTTSRKYALALLEHMDAIGETVRDGDFRRLK